MRAKDKNSELKNRVLKELYFQQNMSQADLSLLISKSLPVVSRAVSELMQEGLVVEKGFAPSSGGRRPLIYSLRPDGMFVLSVAMDQLSTQMVLVDMLNKPVSGIETFDLELSGNTGALSALTGRINSFIKKSGIPREKIAGVGIGMPGFVDTQKGINYTFLDAGDSGIPGYVSSAVGLPVYVDNDSSLVALAELRFGAARTMENAMVVNIGWGIGLGMIVNGELFGGHSGFAGEFSHIPISENGALCGCGKRGCLETECSLLVVARKAVGEVTSGRVSSLRFSPDERPEKIIDSVMAAANKGDQLAVELFADAGYVIGKGLAILIHIMNPESIILSGKGASVGRILLASAQQALHKYAIPRLAGATSLQVSELGANAGLIGAAALVIDNFDRIKRS